MKPVKITTLAAVAALLAPTIALAAPPPTAPSDPGIVPVTVGTLLVGGAIKTPGEKPAAETAADRALPTLPVTYDDKPAATPVETKAPTT